MNTAKLGEVAHAQAASLSFQPSDVVWQLTLDQIESQSGRILDHVTGRASGAGSSTHVFDEGNVLYSKLRPYLNKVVCPDSPGISTTELVPLRPDPDRLDRRYLTLYLRSKRFVKWISNKVAGAKMPRVKMKVFWDHAIPLPPLAEQKRIAAILDAADAMRAKRRESLALLDALIQSTFLEMFGDPVNNPMAWERRTLGEIIKFVGGSQPPKDSFTYEPSQETVRLVQIRDFKSDKYKTYIPKRLARRPFTEDDVMIARYGPPVFQILTGLSGSYNVALMKAAPIGPINKLFIFHLLSHPSVHGAVVAKSERTAGQSGVNLQFLNNYLAYLPPLDLQQRFTAIVESIEKQKVSQRAHLAELDMLFASLQSRAFCGDL